MSQIFQKWTKRKIINWLERMDIKNYIVHDNGIVDVEGNVDISECNLKVIPVQFGHVSGQFSCARNKLSSLQGSPLHVTKLVACDNKITSLRYCSEDLEFLDCSYNKLSNLKFCPSKLKELLCSVNQIRSLRHTPTSLHTLDCSRNSLISLKHCPSPLNIFLCTMNALKTLKYCPVVKDKFDCSWNALKTLKHAPAPVDYFSCSGNPLRSVKYAPSSVFEFSAVQTGLKTLQNTPECKRLYVYNNELKNLFGISQMVETLNCAHNKIEHFQGLPNTIKYIFGGDNCIQTLKGLSLNLMDLELDNNPLMFKDFLESDITIHNRFCLTKHAQDELIHRFKTDYIRFDSYTWYHNTLAEIKTEYQKILNLKEHLDKNLQEKNTFNTRFKI